MKKDLKQILKAAVALLIVPIMFSSCVVRERAHRPPPPDRDRVIIRP